MSLGIIPADQGQIDGDEEKLLVDDDEDDDFPSLAFGNLSTLSQQGHSKTQVHDMEAFSAERELTNFLTGSNSHFQNCKLTAYVIDDAILISSISDAKQTDIDIVHSGNVSDLVDKPFKPYGPDALAYWDVMINNSPKLYKIVKKLSLMPTSSSSLERIFSDLSHKVGKNATNYKSETLCLLHQSSASSLEFINILKSKSNAANTQ